MPEIKHNFSQGKMNKDLDERLVPNGQYRDALNIRVSTSEGSDVGAVTNILGNTKISNKNLLLNDAVCIGAISDEKNDCFYWFVKNKGNDYILRYSKQDGIQPVLVDTLSSALNFQDNIITGINIIEDLLFWTDNYNEPKKINIKNCMLGTPDFATQTVVHNPFIDNVIGGYSNSTVAMKEEHVTVIKRAPLRAPYLELVPDGSFNVPGVEKRHRFTDPSNPTVLLNAGDVVTNLRIHNSSAQRSYNITAGVTVIQLKSVSANQIGFDTDGDPLALIDQLNENFNQEYSYNSDYDIRLKITAVGTQVAPDQTNALSGYVDVEAEILNIKTSTTPNFSAWVVNFEQATETLFENKFPRFAYRYKYIDGEYSPFSPFTRVAFNPSIYSADTVRGYNLGMRNDLKEVKLEAFVTKDFTDNQANVQSKKIPHDVVGIDLLYKESNSPAVYIVDSLTPKDISWDAPASASISSIGTGSYSITSDTIYKIVASNQLLRGFDSVPKKALAQEVIGNRVVYGNYTQNIDLQESIGLDFSYSASGINIVDEVGVPSIKTLRNYQLGVVYEDKYGRQTPILTNKDAVINLPITESKVPSFFKASITSTAPDEADTFKFFIKETSSEYYNLPLARWYNAEDGNIWLSFISADRNKIDEEDYLYLKKAHGSDRCVETPNKYKVLAIANEAPDFIKTDRQSFGELVHDSNLDDLLFNDYTFTPIKGKSVFRVNSDLILSSGYADIENADNLEMVLSDPITNSISNRYQITSAIKDTLNPSGYIITIKGIFGTDVNFIEDTSSTPSIPVIKDGIVLEITKGEIKNKPEFDGKFFVKINQDFNTSNYVITFNDDPNEMAIIHQEPLYYFTETNVPQFTQPGGNNWGNINSANTLPTRNNSGTYSLLDASTDAQSSVGLQGTPLPTTDPDGPKWFIDKLPFEGLRQGPAQNSDGTNDGINGYYIDIAFSGIPIAPGGTVNTVDVDGWIVGETSNSYTDQEVTMTENLNAGKRFYFADDPDKTLYTITNVEIIDTFNYIDVLTGNLQLIPYYGYPQNFRRTWRLKLDKEIVNQTFDPRSNTINQVSATNPVSINFVEYLEERDGSVKLTKNPAVFETKPKKDEGLEIYHEASDSYDVATRHGDAISIEWYNCFIFGNGVESDRIQDDFNAPTIDNGPKVSAEFDGEYKQETVSNRLTFSGIYNSTSSINRTNEFIIAENITKDLNPTYGSIQKLYTRNSDLVVFCEDKVLRILANKDALFNADGNPQLTATDRVLGQSIPFAGDYGISKNPESFAYEKYRAYFTDKQRGAVLRLSMDGLTPISEYGMSNYFRDNFKLANKIIGSYDAYNKEYNVTISFDDKKETVSYKEQVNGWSSFKSYTPELALSSSNTYYSFDKGGLYEHDSNNKYNYFYDIQYNSSVTVLLNDVSGSIKDYKTLNYEGTQSRVVKETSDVKSGYYNLQDKRGWFSDYVKTDQDEGDVNEFIEKEGKWFNYIKGK